MISCTSRKTLALTLAVCLSFGFTVFAQDIPTQDLGSSGLLQALTKLKTTARLLHSTAHPDDDDGSMLTYEARGEGADTLMLTLNRGEGGQNKVGSELFDQLGVLRTLELLEAGRFYGVDQRFTRVVDFGFSKNAPETFAQWGGHDIALEDMVRVIREFRPDVIVSRFSGTQADGHGNHQAAGTLSREAFKAAADPNRFPEQIREGLLPWQVKKLYAGGNDRENSLRFNTGAYNPVLGMSYWQMSVEGLKHQASQGVGGGIVSSGPNMRQFRLVESVLASKPTNEKSFFDGIDTSIPGLAARIGNESAKAPFLEPALKAIDHSVDAAVAAFDARTPSHSAPALLEGLGKLRELLRQVETSSLSAAAKTDLLAPLRAKEKQFENAANLALGTELDVTVDSGSGVPEPTPGMARQQETLMTAVPGATFTATARFYNRSPQNLVLKDVSLQTPPGWKVERIKADLKSLAAGESASAQFRITVPENVQYTRPYWQRKDYSQSVYQIISPEYATLALPPWPASAVAVYTRPSEGGAATGEGSIRSVLQVRSVDPIYGQMEQPLPAGPALSVEIENPVQVVPIKSKAPIDVTVNVRNQVHGAAQTQVSLKVPQGWKSEAASPTDIKFALESEEKRVQFRLQPPKLQQGFYDLSASADYKGKPYAESVTTIGRKDVGYFYYYRPANQRVSAVDVEVVSGLKVGYIMGAGDDIPTVLSQIGIPVAMITPDQLANGNLSQFDTIIVGIRAYDTRSDVQDFNSRLLDYVNRGGTLVVQYNSGTRQFTAGKYTPYPASLGVPRNRNTAAAGKDNKLPETDRVTDENAPVKLLAPQHPLLTSPNRITDRDFQGWVQERGLYFMTEWDSHYTPLLSMADPGEDPLKGSLLTANYGKGTYIYTSLAFFRQLPAGVPGAIRLFVNLLSAGHTAAQSKASTGSTPVKQAATR